MIFSVSLSGIDALLIEVESSVDKRSVIRGVDIVGMGDTAVKESEKRVRSALKSNGFDFLKGRVTVNLSPADVKKSGSQFDLPIALSILSAIGELKGKKIFAMGELSLDGKIRRVKGVLPAALKLKEVDFDGVVIVPKENEKEVAVAGLRNTFAIGNIREAVELINDLRIFESIREVRIETHTDFDVDMDEVRGQEFVKRALEIAAAGGHNILMIGPPGSGKTMLARRFQTILPEMTIDEVLETSRIYSVAGFLDDSLVTKRPFRSPHHTSSVASIVGGGANARPGEISLAHNGVLFMDELPEFRRDVLEALREPLEEGRITVARSRAVAVYPASFIFIGAMNPCGCAEIDDDGECICSENERMRYMRKISGPILDRIDIHVRVRRMNFGEYRNARVGERSSSIRERVIEARRLQLARGKLNAKLSHRETERFVEKGSDSEKLLEKFADRLKLSGRAIDKILKVSRTIADLDGSDRVLKKHLLEALQYRMVSV